MFSASAKTLSTLVLVLSAVILSSVPASVVEARELAHYNKRARLMTRQTNTDPTDFGTCSTPEVEGGLGFDGRTEFSFQPVDKTSFDHSSAQNIEIITQFICDTLVNTCGLANGDASVTLCRNTQAAVGAGKNDGSLADKFNAAFGVTTDFANAAGSTTAVA